MTGILLLRDPKSPAKGLVSLASLRSVRTSHRITKFSNCIVDITQLSRDGSLSSYSGDDTGDSFRRIRASFSEYVIRLVKLHTTSYANLNDEVDVSEIDDSTIVKIIKSPKYKRGSSFFKNVLSDKEIDNIAHEMKQLHCGLPDLQTMSFDFKDYNNIFKASDLIEWFWDKKYIASNSEGSILAQELLIRHHIFPFPPKESNDQPEFKKEFALYYYVSHSRRIKEFMESEHFEFPEVWINRMITQGPEHCKKLRVNGKAYENAFQGSTLLSWLQNFPEFGVGDNAERFCQFLAEEDFIITLNSKRAEFSSRVFRVVQSKGNTKEESATRIAVASPELLHLLYLLSDESHILVYLLRSYYLHSSASSHPSEAPEVFLDSDNHEQDLDLGIALVKLLFDYTPSFWEEAERLLCGRSAIVKALLIDLRWLYVTRRQHHECAVANDLLSQESCSYCTRTEQDFNEWLIENFRSKTCWSLETRDALVSLLIQRNWTMVKGTVFSQDIIRPQLLKGFLKALQYAPSDVVSAALLDLTTLLLTNRRNGIRIGKIDNWRAMFIPFICYNYGNELAHPLSCVVLVTYVLMSTPTEFCETMDSLIREIQIYPGLEPFSIKSRERVFKFLNHVIRHTIADMITRSNKLSPDDPGWSSIMYISELVIAFCFQTVNWGTIGTYRKLFSTKSPSTVEEFGVHSNETGSLMVESRLGLVELVVDLYSPLCTFLNEPAICNGSSTAKVYKLSI